MWSVESRVKAVPMEPSGNGYFERFIEDCCAGEALPVSLEWIEVSA